MTHRRGWMTWATGALVLAAVTACGHSETDPSADPTPSTVGSFPAPSVTSSVPASPTELAAAQATQKLRDYYAVLDRLGQHPKSSLKPLQGVAISTELAADRNFLLGQHQRGERQVGSLKLLAVTVQSVNLDNSDPGDGHVPTVVIDVCHDVSGVDVIDKSGKSVVLPTRPVRAWTRWTVANYHFTKNPSDGWRVASGKDLTRTPCASS